MIFNKETVKEYSPPLLPLPTHLKVAGKLEHPIAGILFDVYGTLFISASGDIGVMKANPPRTENIQDLLKKYEINTTPQLLLRDLQHAIEKSHTRSRKQGIDFPEVEIDKIWMDILKKNNQEFIRQFATEFELIVNPVYPMPHLKQMLSALKQAQLAMGIVSNAQFYTPYLFNWFLGCDLQELGFHPDLILWSYQLKHAKPSPLLFDKAAEKLRKMGIPQSAVLYLGNDMLNDIYAAGKAGFKTGLYAGDARSLRLRTDDPRCATISADLVITDLIQLLEHIK
jgi:putative hydrolase of the HAD superfamily